MRLRSPYTLSTRADKQWATDTVSEGTDHYKGKEYSRKGPVHLSPARTWHYGAMEQGMQHNPWCMASSMSQPWASAVGEEHPAHNSFDINIQFLETKEWGMYLHTHTHIYIPSGRCCWYQLCHSRSVQSPLWWRWEHHRTCLVRPANEMYIAQRRGKMKSIRNRGKGLSPYFTFTFGGFNHKGARNWPRHCRSMESIIYQTLRNIFSLYTSSVLQRQKCPKY